MEWAIDLSRQYQVKERLDTGKIDNDLVELLIHIGENQEPVNGRENRLNPNYLFQALFEPDQHAKVYKKDARFKNDGIAGLVVYKFDIVDNGGGNNILQCEVVAVRSVVNRRDMGALMENMTGEDLANAEGCGTAILKDLEKLILECLSGEPKFERGEIVLDAISNVVGFYRRNGFRPRGINEAKAKELERKNKLVPMVKEIKPSQ